MNRVVVGGALGLGAYLAYQALKPRYVFHGKHVLITGGSRGLGLVLARELGAQGARLSICGREHNELVRAQDDLSRRGINAFAAECDVTDRQRVEELVATARQANGPVDVLVNNAGIIQVGPAGVMRDEDYEASLRTHFWAALHTTAAVVPEMKARREGRIINIASIGGKVAVPHLLPYTVGKFALVGLSAGLREELARWGIVVTTVCPGLMRTGSHLNALFKGNREREYNWFAAGVSVRGLSMSAESAARRIVNAAARGDAEVILGLPAKAAVAVQALCPNLMSDLLALINRLVLPDPSGDKVSNAKGSQSRGRMPRFVTKLPDRAAAANNEEGAAALRPPLPA